MPKIKTLTEVYDGCVADGYYKTIQEINIQKVKSLIENAQTNISSAHLIAKAISKTAKEWMNVFTLQYDALRMLTEALLHLQQIELSNHQCLFSALCVKYPSLELNWEFLEQIRTKRNGINYYGEHITYEDWKKIELQMSLYCSTLKKEIESRIAKSLSK